MKNSYFFVFLFLFGGLQTAKSQSSGAFCMDLNQAVKYAAGKFELIRGPLLPKTKTLEYESKMILSGTMKASVRPGPESGAVHFLSPMPVGNDIVATRTFRDNMIEMTNACMDGMGYTMKPSTVKINGEDAMEMTFFSYDFPATKNMKLQVYIQKNPEGYSVVVDLMYQE